MGSLNRRLALLLVLLILSLSPGLRHSQEVRAATPSWSSWESLGGSLSWAPAAAATGTGRIDALTAETDGQLWDYVGSTRQVIPGAHPTVAPSAMGTSSQVDVFYRGTDLGLWRAYWFAGTWYCCQPLGGKLADEPSVANVGGAAEVFVRGTDNKLWYWSNFKGWSLAGGVLAAAPSATAVGWGEFDALVKGADQRLWWWSSVSGWHGLGGLLIGKPAAVSWGFGRIDAFVGGTDYALWHWSNATGWQRLGGRFSGVVAADTWGSPHLDAFVQGADYAVWHAWSNGSGWQWESLDGQTLGGIAAVTSSVNAIDLFVRGTDGLLWHRAYR